MIRSPFLRTGKAFLLAAVLIGGASALVAGGPAPEGTSTNDDKTRDRPEPPPASDTRSKWEEESRDTPGAPAKSPASSGKKRNVELPPVGDDSGMSTRRQGRAPTMEKYVSRKANFVIYKPAGWRVKEDVRGTCLVLTVTDPLNKYLARMDCGANIFGQDMVGLIRILGNCTDSTQRRAADFRFASASISNDKRRLTAEIKYTDQTAGPREGRCWVSAQPEGFTFSYCEAPAGEFKAARKVLLTILSNIEIIRNTIPRAPKILSLSQHHLADGSASFGLPPKWSVQSDLGTGHFVAKDARGLAGFSVISIEMLTPELHVNVPGAIVLPYQSPHQAMETLATQLGLASDVRFIEILPRDDVVKLIERVYTAGPVKVEEFVYTYLANGTRQKGYTFGISWGSRIGVNWRFSHLSVNAPAAEFDELVPTLAAVALSYRIDDDFARKYIANGMAHLRQMQLDTARIIAKNADDIHAMMTAAYEERQRSQDWIDYNRTSYIRGETDWISSMEGGTVYHTDSWGTRNTYTGDTWEGAPFNYTNFEGQNPRYNEQMTAVNNRQLYERMRGMTP